MCVPLPGIPGPGYFTYHICVRTSCGTCLLKSNPVSQKLSLSHARARSHVCMPMMTGPAKSHATAVDPAGPSSQPKQPQQPPEVPKKSFSETSEELRDALERAKQTHEIKKSPAVDQLLRALTSFEDRIHKMKSKRICVLANAGHGKSTTLNSGMDATCLSEQRYRQLIEQYTAQEMYPAPNAETVSEKHFCMKDYKLVEKADIKHFYVKDDITRKKVRWRAPVNRMHITLNANAPPSWTMSSRISRTWLHLQLIANYPMPIYMPSVYICPLLFRSHMHLFVQAAIQQSLSSALPMSNVCMCVCVCVCVCSKSSFGCSAGSDVILRCVTKLSCMYVRMCDIVCTCVGALTWGQDIYKRSYPDFDTLQALPSQDMCMRVCMCVLVRACLWVCKCVRVDLENLTLGWFCAGGDSGPHN
jgi:hypothetical protein